MMQQLNAWKIGQRVKKDYKRFKPADILFLSDPPKGRRDKNALYRGTVAI